MFERGLLHKLCEFVHYSRIIKNKQRVISSSGKNHIFSAYAELVKAFVNERLYLILKMFNGLNIEMFFENTRDIAIRGKIEFKDRFKTILTRRHVYLLWRDVPDYCSRR